MKKINATLKKISGLDCRLMEKTQKRLDNLTKPQGSLGRLEELAKLIVGITGKENPEFKNKVIFTLASDHGVTYEGVSPFPKEVTAQMVYNFINGGAGINVLASHVGARVIVADMGVAGKLEIKKSSLKAEKIRSFKDKKINYGTRNMAKGPSMSREEAIRSIESGIELLEDELKKGVDIIGTGEMGIGNTTASSAITSIFTKQPVELVVGRGAGLDDKGLENKITVIKKVLAVNKPDVKDAMDVLAKIGGFEIGGLTGVILACGANKIPVVIDGFISGAAALVAYHLEPKIKDYMIASHVSVEKGHRVILEHIGLKPLFDLNLRLGEGTGAALGINIAEAAVKILTQMATFKQANVSERSG